MAKQSVMRTLEEIQANMGMAMDAAQSGTIALKEWKKFPITTRLERELIRDYEKLVNVIIKNLGEALRKLRD